MTNLPIACTLDPAELHFDLTTEPNGGPFRLAVTGPAGTREFLDALTESGGNASSGH